MRNEMTRREYVVDKLLLKRLNLTRKTQKYLITYVPTNDDVLKITKDGLTMEVIKKEKISCAKALAQLTNNFKQILIWKRRKYLHS